VVAASTGNHGAAVAYAGAQLGVPARIFVPVGANRIKASRIRGLGATLVATGIDLSDAIDAAAHYAQSHDAFFLHDASNPDIPIGTATIGAEICEQCPTLDRVYVPMGDTALIRGVASAIRLTGRPVHVIGVVAASAPAYALSYRAGEVVETATADTIADGLAVRRPLLPNVEAIRTLVDTVMMVSEQEMRDAIQWLQEHEAVVAEPSAAASVAALQKDPERSSTSVAIVTGQSTR
jgi:threonine dehydratase